LLLLLILLLILLGRCIATDHGHQVETTGQLIEPAWRMGDVRIIAMRPVRETPYCSGRMGRSSKHASCRRQASHTQPSLVLLGSPRGRPAGLPLAERTHSRSTDYSALNALVETGKISEFQALDRLDDWKSRH